MTDAADPPAPKKVYHYPYRPQAKLKYYYVYVCYTCPDFPTARSFNREHVVYCLRCKYLSTLIGKFPVTPAKGPAELP